MLVRVAAILADLVIVVVFAVLGRSSHAEGLDVAGVARTAWPFLAACAAAWLVLIAAGRPGTKVPSGVVVWLVTVFGGTVLRLFSGETAQPMFVVVALLFLGVSMLLWRGVVTLAGRRRLGSA